MESLFLLLLLLLLLGRSRSRSKNYEHDPKPKDSPKTKTSRAKWVAQKQSQNSRGSEVLFVSKVAWRISKSLGIVFSCVMRYSSRQAKF